MGVSMSRIKFAALAACLALIAGLSAIGSAGAHTVKIPDGNDVAGPLDISRTTASHKGSTMTHTITTFARWKPRLLRNGKFFLYGFSVDGDPSAPEGFLYIFFANGRLRGVATDTAGNPLFNVKVTRPNSRTVKFNIGAARLSYPGGYHWQAGSYVEATNFCRKGCLDSAPNGRKVALLDYVPPLAFISSSTNTGLTSELSTGLSVPIQYTATDVGYSGVKSVRMQRRALGSSTWTTVVSGIGAGNNTVNVNFAPGATYDLRLQVADGAGHVSLSTPLRLTAPLDETVGTFTGTWSNAGTTNDYLQTLKQSSTVDDTFSYEFTGSRVDLIGRGGSVAVSIDGGSETPVTLSGAYLERFFVATGLGVGTHTVQVRVTGGTFNMDGVAIR